MMPKQKPHRSVQSVQTPPDLMMAIETRFGRMDFDLCADECNKQAGDYLNEIDNSLVQDWDTIDGNLWCNPPYGDIEPWVKKAAGCSQDTTIYMLVPASVGSNWYAHYVHECAYVLALSPRVKFVSHKTPFPKDLLLVCYGLGFKGFDIWRWKD